MMRILALQALLWLPLLVPIGSAAERGEYRVTFSDAQRRTVRVEADLAVDGRTLLVSPIGANDFEAGWAHWIKDLAVTDPDGKPVRVDHRGRGKYRLRDRARRVHLSYEVRLDHEDHEWPFGLDEATYLRDDCTYVATQTLFLAPPNLERALVRFELPDDWIVSTSWEPAPAAEDADAGLNEERYVVRSFEQLTRACLLVGEHSEERVRAAGVEVLLAVGDDLRDSTPRMVQTLEAALYEATVLFGGDAPGQRYIVVANMADYSGGAGHVGGMSMVFAQPPSAADATWAHVCLHELLHMWIGVAIRRANSEAEWFQEGVTDYLAMMLLARAGIADEGTLLEMLGRSYGNYALRAGRRSLASAGRDKAAETGLLYGGGLYMGLLLDVEIRSGSRGRHSIQDLLQILYIQFGNSDEAYTSLEVAGIASDLAGRDVGKLFDRYVEGSLRIPVAAYLRRLGLALEADGIAPHPGSTETQERLRSAIFGS
ncbi:MAG: hypothetical protein GY711_01395 [bacterium]|nr:hypothetical protein [bacterium]